MNTDTYFDEQCKEIAVCDHAADHDAALARRARKNKYIAIAVGATAIAVAAAVAIAANWE